MKYTWRKISIILLLVSSTGLAAQTDSTIALNEAVIYSEKLDVYYDKQSAVFTKNVEFLDKTMELYSDKLTVLFAKKKTVKSLEAMNTVGEVKVILYSENKDKTIAQAKTVSYNAKTQKVTLVGNASVVSSGYRLSGNNKITFNLKNGEIKNVNAESGKGDRVKMTINLDKKDMYNQK